MRKLDEIEELRRELVELRVITRNLRNQNIGQEKNNCALSRRTNELDQTISATFKVDDRIEANKPTCYSRNRALI